MDEDIHVSDEDLPFIHGFILHIVIKLKRLTTLYYRSENTMKVYGSLNQTFFKSNNIPCSQWSNLHSKCGTNSCGFMEVYRSLIPKLMLPFQKDEV